MSEIKLIYNVPISESGMLDNEFLIQGTAINATITSNNHKFLAEELRSSASSLNGVPLLVDHDNRIECIKGRVIKGEYDESNSRINFKAKVKDQTIKQMIKDGLINSVSVGASVSEIEESEDGILIPRGICFKELSLVAVPADAGATFTTALAEAYKTSVNHTIQEDTSKCIVQNTPTEKQIHIQTEKEVIPSQVSEELKGGIKMSEETIKVEEKQVVVAEKSAEMIALMEQMKAMQEMIKTLSAKKEEVTFKAEVAEVEEKAKYNIEQGFGSIRGNSFTLVR
jgi:hypothetical protein